MKRNAIISLIVLPTLAMSWQASVALADSTGHEEDSLSDNRMKVLYYDANDVYTIFTRVGYETYVEFSKQEEIDTISVGDRSLWQLIPANHRLFIRPLRNDIATNMTVITNKRAYQFDLKAVADEKQKIVYVARFSYPEDERMKMRTMQQTAISNPFLPNAPLQLRQQMASEQIVPPQPPIATAPVSPPPPQQQPAEPPKPEPRPMEEPRAQAQRPEPQHMEPKQEEPARLEQQAMQQPEPRPMPAEPAKSEMAAPALSDAQLAKADMPPARETAVSPPRLAEIPPPEKRNYNFSFSGPESVSPYEVFDDGSTTYFRYNPPALMAPQVGILEKDGTETAATVYQNGAYFAVDVVAPKLLMHTPSGTAYVFNETLAKKP